MGSFKLGGMTFGSLFKKPETVLYPLETKTPPAGSWSPAGTGRSRAS